MSLWKVLSQRKPRLLLRTLKLISLNGPTTKMTNATATTADVATCMRYANKQNSLIKLDILIDRCLSHEKVVASVQTQTWTSLACSCLFCSHAVPFCAHAVPFTSHVVPFCVHAVPFTSHAVPFCAHAIPFTSHVVPFCAHAVPFISHAVPFCAQSIYLLSHTHIKFLLWVLKLNYFIVFLWSGRN